MKSGVIHAAELHKKGDGSPQNMTSNSGPKKSSGGFSHFIHGIENKAKSVGQSVHNFESNIATNIKKIPHVIEEGALDVGHGLQRVAHGIGDTISDLEKATLPSSTSIITETGLVVGGLAIVGILVFKFL